MAAVRHAQLARELDHPVGAHDGGIEAVEVDAGRNGLEPAVERGEALHGIARHMLGHRDHRVGARLAALDEALGDAAREEGRVQGGDPLDRRDAAPARAPPRRWWAIVPGSARRAPRCRLEASLPGSMSRPHSAWPPSGSSRCVARSRSRSGTMAPPGEATMAEPPAAITACAASSVARASPPPARVGTICRSVGAADTSAWRKVEGCGR